MSRVEENRIWIESIPSRLTGSLEDVSRKIEAYKLQALIDISKSLAIIASDKDITVEADSYVRDHLLIEFMIERKYHPFTDVEDMYSDWKEWLKESEEKNAERSKI